MSKNNKTNKLLDFLNVELPDIRKSYCNLTRANRFTASLGYIYPTLVEEILPSDRVKCNLKSILKSAPTVNSIYGSMRQSHQAYFVPLRFYIRYLDQNFTWSSGFNNTPSIEPSALPNFPQLCFQQDLEPSIGFINPGSLVEMLEMLPSDFNFSNAYSNSDTPIFPNINAVPLIAYYDIIRNFYFNSQEPNMTIVRNEYFRPYLSQDGEDPFESPVYVNVSTITKTSLDDFIRDVYNGYFTPDFEGEQIGVFDYLSNIGIDLISISPFSGVNYSEELSSRTFRNVHQGYAVRCFDDDYFTTSLSNAYVSQLDNSVRVQVTANTTSGASFAVSQLTRARQMARHVSRDLLGGTNYDDYIYVHFNTKLGRELNKPYFLGSCSSDFWFDDIYASTVGTDGQSLGSRAGVLDNSMQYNDFIDFTASEYGYLIVLSSILPRISYYAGIPKKYLKTSMSDLYSPEFDAWGFQGIPTIEYSANARTQWNFGTSDPNGEPFIADQYKGSANFDSLASALAVQRNQPAWFEHMASYDRIHGLFTSDMEHSFSVITKDFVPGTTNNLSNLVSSYIRPWEFQYLFKFQPSWYDNFTWQILFDLTIYRPISKQILPSY